VSGGELELRPVANWRTSEGLKAFEVVQDGEVIGRIEQFRPTFERAPRGSRIVSKRWTAKKPYWAAVWPGHRHAYSLPYETKKRAVAEVVAARARTKETDHG
jgi:hypothetical protein